MLKNRLKAYYYNRFSSDYCPNSFYMGNYSEDTDNDEHFYSLVSSDEGSYASGGSDLN